jgi:hypothetical protein
VIRPAGGGGAGDTDGLPLMRQALTAQRPRALARRPHQKRPLNQRQETHLPPPQAGLQHPAKPLAATGRGGDGDGGTVVRDRTAPRKRPAQIRA